jgi:hypothetical protein
LKFASIANQGFIAEVEYNKKKHEYVCHFIVGIYTFAIASKEWQYNGCQEAKRLNPFQKKIV